MDEGGSTAAGALAGLEEDGKHGAREDGVSEVPKGMRKEKDRRFKETCFIGGRD